MLAGLCTAIFLLPDVKPTQQKGFSLLSRLPTAGRFIKLLHAVLLWVVKCLAVNSCINFIFKPDLAKILLTKSPLGDLGVKRVKRGRE